MRLFFILLGSALLVWYLAPIAAAIFNIGNACGTAFSAFLILFGAFFYSLPHWLQISGCCIATAVFAAAVPVSIKMAKEQSLSLSPTKISGICGRLMCCLKYEQDAYEDAIKRMPKNDSFVLTPDGTGNVSDINVLKETVNVRLDDRPEGPRCYHNCEVCVLRNGKAHKNNFYHTLEVVDNVAKRSDNLWLRWAALFHDVGKTRSKRWEPAIGWTFHNHNYVGAKMIPAIFRRMKLPMDAKMKYVEKMVDLHMRPIVIADEEVTDSAVRRLLNDAGDDIDDLMMLCEADITSKNEVRKKRFLENFRMVREKLTDLKERDYKRLLQPVIDGNEIMEIFNLKPCREVGTLKQYLKDAVLDNKVANEREPLMQLLMQKAEEMGVGKN